VYQKIHVPKIHFIKKLHQIKGHVNNVLRIVNAGIVLKWMIIVPVAMKRASLINFYLIHYN
jgi:hypothetical protein